MQSLRLLLSSLRACARMCVCLELQCADLGRMRIRKLNHIRYVDIHTAVYARVCTEHQQIKAREAIHKSQPRSTHLSSGVCECVWINTQHRRCIMFVLENMCSLVTMHHPNGRANSATSDA